MAMPKIPDKVTIKNRIIADLETALGQTTPWLPKAWNRSIAGSLTGLFLLCYNAILWVYEQAFPEKADYEALILLGKLVGLVPTKSVAAIITADVAGTEGETVAVGTLFQSTTGIVYKVTTGGIISSGVASCILTAQTRGEAGNTADGEVLSIVSADPVLTGTATVTGTTTSGAEAESEEHFRARVVARYKRRVTGGSPADYENWGLETPHFVWVSPYAHESIPGRVVLYGRVDNQPDGIPTAAQLLELKNMVTYDPETGKKYRRPIGDEVECLAISRYLFDIEISIKDASALVKANIENALIEYLDSLEPYNEGISSLRNDAVTNAGISAAIGSIAKEAGATILQIVVKETLTGTTVNNYILYGGEHAKMNSITFEDVV